MGIMQAPDSDRGKMRKMGIHSVLGGSMAEWPRRSVVAKNETEVARGRGKHDIPTQSSAISFSCSLHPAVDAYGMESAGLHQTRHRPGKNEPCSRTRLTSCD